MFFSDFYRLGNVCVNRKRYVRTCLLKCKMDYVYIFYKCGSFVDQRRNLDVLRVVIATVSWLYSKNIKPVKQNGINKL